MVLLLHTVEVSDKQAALQLLAATSIKSAASYDQVSNFSISILLPFYLNVFTYSTHPVELKGRHAECSSVDEYMMVCSGLCDVISIRHLCILLSLNIKRKFHKCT